jgi:hypothetical protein
MGEPAPNLRGAAAALVRARRGKVKRSREGLRRLQAQGRGADPPIWRLAFEPGLK